MVVALPVGLADAVARVEGEVERPRLLRSAVLRAQLLRLALRGVNAKQACEVLGCSYHVARSHYADPSFRAQVLQRVEGALAYADERFALQNRSLHERIADAAEEGFERLVEMLRDPGTANPLKARIAQDFLNRVPEAAPHSSVLHRHSFTAEELSSAAKAAAEMGEAGRVIEIRKSA